MSNDSFKGYCEEIRKGERIVGIPIELDTVMYIQVFEEDRWVNHMMYVGKVTVGREISEIKTLFRIKEGYTLQRMSEQETNDALVYQIMDGDVPMPERIIVVPDYGF